MDMALTKCFFCGESDKILLGKRLIKGTGKLEREVHGKVVDMEPCSKCAGYMKQGVIILGIDEQKSEPGWNKPNGQDHWMPNPYRTGDFSVVKDAFFQRVDDEMARHALKVRWIFMTQEAGRKLGVFQTPTPKES